MSPNSKSYRVRFPSTDAFVMIRLSLVWICEGNYTAAAILKLILWIDSALTRSVPDGQKERPSLDTQEGALFRLTDHDIADRMAPYNGTSLCGVKAIGVAIAYLKRRGFIEVKPDPKNRLNRSRHVRVVNLPRLQLLLDQWAEANPRMPHGVNDLAVR